MRKLLAILTTSSLAVVGSLAADMVSRPNIIFILADDLGIGNVSCCGADNSKTPHIDALAKSDIRFANCYPAPLCGPSRAILMTVSLTPSM